MKNLANEWLEYDEDSGVKFQIKGLSVITMSGVRQDLVPRKKYNIGKEAYEDVLTLGPYALTELLRCGLVDWTGIVDSEGNKVEYNFSNIEYLDSVQVDYIAYSIFNKSTMDDAERKKSLLLQTSLGTRKSTIAKPARKGTVAKKRNRASKKNIK